MMQFKTLLNKHKGRDLLICCPGKNITEWLNSIQEFKEQNNLLTLGCNKISELMKLDYHMFTNNDKYEMYGNMVESHSTLILGKNIKKAHIRKHNPRNYVIMNCTDETEKMRYDKKRDIIRGYYRTSGNLAVMLCHLMGANVIYIAGMSGYTYQFDGRVHYYKAEIKRDKKKKKRWKWYDNVTIRVLDNLKKCGINFQIITPTIYRKHYSSILVSHVF